ncbi:MAG: CPBP family intramembrane metalloprotease [Bacteroidetes bacterium]|nr:CPBP family intramembrane metalloprotease [Bacteroidota bacterium]
MGLSFREEWNGIRRAVQKVDKQAAVVLLSAALIVIFQMNWGDRSFFRMEIAPLLDASGHGLGEWAWWFGMQGVLGLLIPIAILKWGFRASWTEMGLGLGDYSFALKIAAIYLPLVLLGTWFLSSSSEFQASYPHYPGAALNWKTFLIYEALFLFYWLGWEYLWRGFVLFGTSKAFGVMAIFIQAMPFAILHFNKPLPEALLSVVGGVALGALVWRSKSFWIAVPIHAAQMFMLDFWCSLRIRSGDSGIGIEALLDVLKAF